jgi:DNA-binding Lrp family transcriptional regulator
MNSTLQLPKNSNGEQDLSTIKQEINSMIDSLISSLPDRNRLSNEERRGIIARYSAVLEGNFIYWMTAALISVRSEEARPILQDNLHEEVRDAHPVMLRRFAIAANAFPTDSDSLAADEDLTKVRKFLGRLSGVQSVLTMAFFEGFIQRFMGYLASLAAAQGSTEMEYTDVHGVCDIAHTDGLFRALAAEMAVDSLEQDQDLFEGVYLLRNLIETIVFNRQTRELHSHF